MNMTKRNCRLDRVDRLMVACFVSAGLAACGGGGDPGTGAPAAPTPPPPPAPAPVAQSAGDLSSTVLPSTYPASGSKSSAYAALNAARLQGGFGTLAQSDALDSEAQDQADFIAANYTVPSGLGGVSFNGTALESIQADGNETGHVQLTTLPDQTHYVGYLPSYRATHFGYPSADVAESAVFGNWMADAGVTCVAELLQSPAHRQLLLDPRFRDFGVGIDSLPWNSDGSIRASDCYIATAARSYAYSATGQATAPSGWVGIYPPDGSTTSGRDDLHGHGFAPSVTVDSRLTLVVNSFTITDSSGQVVPTTLNMDALSTGMFANWAFATPSAPLDAGGTYTVNFQGMAGSMAIAKVWRFATSPN